MTKIRNNNHIISRAGSNKLKQPIIYLDNAASTPIDPGVAAKIAETSKLYGNPSSFNDAGRLARKELDSSRLSIARFLGAQAQEIMFTSSGSEANNLAILGSMSVVGKNKNEILITPIEHPSILEPAKVLSRKGFKIVYLKVDKEGRVDPADLKKKLTSKTSFISIIYANNEIGTIQPIKKISKIIRDFRGKNLYPLFHTDACQAAEYLDMNVNNLGVDLLTFNGAKIYGPKGCAVLYKRKELPLEALIYGGDQENNLRAGTENLAAIAGLAKATSLINREKESGRVTELRDYFIEKLSLLTEGKINGPLGKDRLPNNVSISLKDISDQNLLLELDKHGIYASSGSACTARSVEPSHVLKAIGVGPEYIGGTLRFSLGRQTKKGDIDRALAILPRVIRDLKKRYN